MKPSGAHTHPEMGRSSGNGWLGILGAIALAAIAGPAAHALSDLIRVLAIALAMVVAAAGLAAALAYRIRHSHTRAMTRPGRRVLPAPEPRALGRAREVHLHFHGISAHDVAAIITRQDQAGS
jgi:hypothetical protein